MCAAPDSRSGPEAEQLLQGERRRLEFARECLQRMRDSLRELKAAGGDPLSTEYLKAELFRRAQALLDDPETPLFFGRIDREAATVDDLGGQERRFYIGRRHVRDSNGDPVVVDWRADVSRAFYRASGGNPMGLQLRRRFGFSGGVMTSFEDERLDLGDARDPADSSILTAEIERPRVGPMRDIVATIQPDQDELVRAGLDRTVCVQGAPGTGKTAVGLHRAAYLLYAHRAQLKRNGVLVIGPNTSFLGYIRALLPALGELDVEQVALADLPGSLPVRGEDSAEVTALKGDERLADVIRRAIYSGVGAPTETLIVAAPARRHRIPAHELAEMIDRELSSEPVYDVVRARLPRLIAEAVRRRMESGGGAPDDRQVAGLARGRDIRQWVDEHWPKVDGPAIVHRLLSDELFLVRHAGGLLEPSEQRLLRWVKPAASARRARWSTADSFLLDEAAGLLERPRSYGHVVIDEAQDLTALQCRAISRRCPSGSMTILGDLAQATASGAVADWSRTLRLLGQPSGHQVALSRGYRVPDEVIGLANGLLPALGVTVPPAVSLRRGPGSLRWSVLTRAEPAGARAAAEVRRLLAEPGSIGLIAAEPALEAALPLLAGADVARVQDGMSARITLVPVTLCKGLEFDHVVLVEPDRIAAELPRGRHWLYVALTRAVSTLTVVTDHAGLRVA